MSNWRTLLLSDTPASRREATLGQIYRGWLQFRSNRLALLGLVIVLGLIFVAAFAPWIATHGPYEQNLAQRLLPPGTHGHWLGTDEFGRDIFSRLVYGARVTLYIVVLVALIAAPIGLIVGTASGYLGGWLDAVLMRITDIFLAFPSLILALAFVAALGPGIENAVIAIALTSWPPYARMARAETLTIRNSDYILVAPGLGFLGLGAQPPMAEWGAMVSAGRRYILDQWWVATIPGIAIFTVSLAFNLLGDGLRDVLDPRQKK
jgi:peptide/nickel transport system permease protein